MVGTHRLLQRDVEFRNLGLVVIDEEQRFGVLQKERFKELRVAVDVLSLSATPIPRTLHMALAGIRDLSVIQTPPEERQPIKTYVTAREDSLVREVVTRELARGGQVFYVHNRVQTIDREAEWMRDLVPEARIAVAHGQMHEDLLASVMRAFIDGEVDVLVCTTIIESGLDIPNANTIVIDNAHRLGLAQLYQLRGRVGRAGQRAYAYLLYPAERTAQRARRQAPRRHRRAAGPGGGIQAGDARPGDPRSRQPAGGGAARRDRGGRPGDVQPAPRAGGAFPPGPAARRGRPLR